MASQFNSIKLLKNPPSAIIDLADPHEISLIPFIITIHSHTVCTGWGGVAKLRISVISPLSRLLKANLAASNAGKASLSTSSASTFSMVIIFLACSTSTCFFDACSVFNVAVSVASYIEMKELI